LPRARLFHVACCKIFPSNLKVLTERSARAILKWHDNPVGKYPKERLEEFWTLLRRFLQENPSVKVSFGQVRNIYRLHSLLRNDFQHYKPGGWSIGKAYLARIVGTGVDFIELAMQHDKVGPRLTGNRIRRLNENLSAARRELAEVQSP
jgi:hypothetical protein